tara:strand:+ start:1384 stop:1569 length:186 start_codon:yes stop_codon:yes gene_type:complete
MKKNLKYLGIGILIFSIIYFISLSACEYQINDKKVNKEDYLRLKNKSNSKCIARFANVCSC